jgi:glyceraldehyde 3-phosphate dehydrogenase
MALRVAINGFGRIGRNLLRATRARNLDVEFVAVNDLTDPGTLALLLRNDSVHGRYNGTVEATDDGLRIDGQELRVLAERDPANLPWSDLGSTSSSNPRGSSPSATMPRSTWLPAHARS